MNEVAQSGVGDVELVGLPRHGEVGDALRQCGEAEGGSEILTRLVAVGCDEKRLRVRETDVFGRTADESTGDVERVLSAFEHAREPVHGPVYVASSLEMSGWGMADDRLVQGGNDVEVLLSMLVVADEVLRRKFPNNRFVDARSQSDRRCTVPACCGARHRAR